MSERTVTEPTIDLLDETWTAIGEVCDGLDDAAWDTPTDLPGWTVRDVVSHIIGTERMLAGDRAPEVDPATFGPHVRNDIGRANEAWVEARRALPGPEVLAELREVTARRLDALRAMSAEQWDAPGFTPEGEGPYRQFMEIRVFDCWLHEQDIRRAVGRPGGLDTAPARHTFERMVRPMGYVVGKRAACPDGTSVLFDVGGPMGRPFAVAVAGRASVVDVPDDPTVTIRCDGETFCALAAGRWSAERAGANGLEISGDAELGQRVVSSMGYTI
ncbi:MAG: maleylpyruvate isomerase family mycothiol-dependent enzyme [Actinomycetota bacterium]|nr:maleylpyruvate isomerase family mycothiol-dependent enzyme [Actinomycetota bacterium]